MTNRYSVNLFFKSFDIGTCIDEEFDNLKFEIKGSSDVVYTYTFKFDNLDTLIKLISNEVYKLGETFYSSGKFYKIEILAG